MLSVGGVAVYQGDVVRPQAGRGRHQSSVFLCLSDWLCGTTAIDRLVHRLRGRRSQSLPAYYIHGNSLLSCCLLRMLFINSILILLRLFFLFPMLAYTPHPPPSLPPPLWLEGSLVGEN